MKPFILATLLVACSSIVSASTAEVIFGGLPATSGNGTTLTQNSTYNGEVTANVNGIPNEDLVCDDFSQTTIVTGNNQVDYSVETISNLSGAMFTSGYVTGVTNEPTNLTETQAYDTLAVLVYNLEQLTPNSANAQSIANYQYAIWDLMEPTGVNTHSGAIKDSPLDSGATTDLQNAFAAVTANVTATKTIESELVIYTPTSSYAGNQEFVGLSTSLGTGGSPTPEPSTWLLMAAAGLFLCVRQARTRVSAVLGNR